jgi:hypothetical protein
VMALPIGLAFITRLKNGTALLLVTSRSASLVSAYAWSAVGVVSVFPITLLSTTVMLCRSG